MARSCMDANNAFGDLELPCIRSSLEANMALLHVILHYVVLYTKRSGEL